MRTMMMGMCEQYRRVRTSVRPGRVVNIGEAMADSREQQRVFPRLP